MNREDGDALLRRMQEQQAKSEAESEAESEEDEGTVAAKADTERAMDPARLADIRRGQNLANDDAQTRSRAEDMANAPDNRLDKPPDLPESAEVSSVAPGGGQIGRGSLTSPTGEALGGGGLSDAIQSRAGDLGGGSLGRGLNFDPLSQGAVGSEPGAAGGDPALDRVMMERDGSLAGMGFEVGPITVVVDEPIDIDIGPEFDVEVGEITVVNQVVQGEEIVFVLDDDEHSGGPPGASRMENPEGDAVETATNLERVTVMRGSQVNPSGNPNDGGDEGDMDPLLRGELASGAMPGSTVLGMPQQDEDVTPIALTQAGSLGSSPVTNPTDPAIGDDGIQSLGGQDAASALGSADSSFSSNSPSAPDLGGYEGGEALGEDGPPHGDHG